LTNKVLPRSFYERNTLTVAQDLLGKILVRRVDGLTLTGRIVETEAYRGADDPASHAYRGRTKRNAVMFGDAGVAYIYMAYGLNFCLNATTERVGKAGAVLIRAIEPLHGFETMLKNRPAAIRQITSLTNGPGKLCQAMRIARDLNGVDLTLNNVLTICEGNNRVTLRLEATGRVGVRKAFRRRWRYFAKDNQFVSRNRVGPAIQR
jgi:DNA-3-methyladenine glycosylase